MSRTVDAHLRYLERDGITRDGERGKAYSAFEITRFDVKVRLTDNDRTEVTAGLFGGDTGGGKHQGCAMIENGSSGVDRAR